MKPLYKKEATIGNYTIGIRDNYSVEVLIDGKVYDGMVMPLLRDEIAPQVGIKVDPKWNTQDLGRKLVSCINEKKDDRAGTSCKGSEDKTVTKEVIVTIEGQLNMLEYSNVDVVAEEGWLMYYMSNGWLCIDAIYINHDWSNNLISKIKMVRTQDYFHSLFSKDGEHPLPVEVHERQTYKGERLDYFVELENGAEFDLKKLQLIFTTELDDAVFQDGELYQDEIFTLAEKIMYDGKEVMVDLDAYTEFGIDGKLCNEATIIGFE